MQILRDRKTKKLWLSQEKYIKWVLERFNMKHAKPVSTPLGSHFKLSKKSCSSSNKEKENMASIPYSSAVGSLMYAMVCTWYVVHCDSQSALGLSKNSTYHSRTKHIDVRYHWLKLIVDQQFMQLRKIHTDKNPTDMLTKAVPKEKLELCAGSAGMNSN